MELKPKYSLWGRNDLYLISVVKTFPKVDQKPDLNQLCSSITDTRRNWLTIKFQVHFTTVVLNVKTFKMYISVFIYKGIPICMSKSGLIFFAQISYSGQRKQIVNENDMKFDSLKSWRLKYFRKNQNCTTREIYLLSSQYLTLFM